MTLELVAQSITFIQKFPATLTEC